MRHGDLIIKNKFVNTFGFKDSRKAVLLEVTQKDINQGTLVQKPGLYAFYGLWYGTDPLNHKCYGKCVEARGRVVGRVRRARRNAKRTVRFLK